MNQAISALYEPRHDKTNKVRVRPAKTQISIGIRPVWSESSLSAWGNHGYLTTHWAQSKDSDQTWRMPRLIWVFAGRILTLLVLSCRGSYWFKTCRVCHVAAQLIISKLSMRVFKAFISKDGLYRFLMFSKKIKRIRICEETFRISELLLNVHHHEFLWLPTQNMRNL